jgi:hypothetical protein
MGARAQAEERHQGGVLLLFLAVRTGSSRTVREKSQGALVSNPSSLPPTLSEPAGMVKPAAASGVFDIDAYRP